MFFFVMKTLFKIANASFINNKLKHIQMFRPERLCKVRSGVIEIAFFFNFKILDLESRLIWDMITGFTRRKIAQDYHFFNV